VAAESFRSGLTCKRKHERWSALDGVADAIYVALVICRDRERMAAFARTTS